MSDFIFATFMSVYRLTRSRRFIISSPESPDFYCYERLSRALEMPDLNLGPPAIFDGFYVDEQTKLLHRIYRARRGSIYSSPFKR